MPLVIGLTGGIGSGKSEALAGFARRGAAVLSSDRIVHRLYESAEVQHAVRARFGHGVFTPDGSIDRAALGRAARAESGGFDFLERLTHPRIGRERERWVAEQRSQSPPPPLLVCEVPLLFENDLADRFDAVLVVTAGEAIRRERVAARGHDFDAMANRQWSEQEKCRRASSYFVNDGPRDELDTWVAQRFAQFTRPAGSSSD